MNCRICNTHISDFISVKEMVLGYKESFDYGICANCNCVQIKEIPNNLSDYYPNHYYSLKTTFANKPFGFLKSLLIKKRDMYHFNIDKSLTGKFLNQLYPASFESGFLSYKFLYQKLSKNKNVTIHDAGCGTGELLHYFSSVGFENLSGSDPFITQDIKHGNLTILKKNLSDVEGNFDIITLNHVFEHVPYPREYLKTVNLKLNQNGKCLIRMPVAFSMGYKKYLNNWVGFEAPRHLHLFSVEGFTKLALECGFEVQEIHFDAIGWHYMVSEGYSNGISLNQQSENTVDLSKMLEYQQLAKKANEQRQGDTCGYYLAKK